MLKQTLIFLGLPVILGLARAHAPHGIAWTGKWPSSMTTSKEAYTMMAQPGDPGFVSLEEVILIQDKNLATILDARSNEEYNTGHIPNSRNLPYYEFEKYHMKALGNLTTQSPIIVYCEGVGCELSFFLGRDLNKMGFRNIRIFYGGYPEWTLAGLAVSKGPL